MYRYFFFLQQALEYRNTLSEKRADEHVKENNVSLIYRNLLGKRPLPPPHIYCTTAKRPGACSREYGMFLYVP